MRYIIANWKMVLTPDESEVLAARIRELLAAKGGVPADTRLVLCPTFTAIEGVGAELVGSENDGLNANPILLGAQDVASQEKGAYTGEVSARELEDLGCAMCIVGHSERRAEFAETDEIVNEKARLLIQHGITPIVCVGETREEREHNRTEEVVATQVRAALTDITPSAQSAILIAYEPRWVIGTGTPITVADAEKVLDIIAQELKARYGESVREQGAVALLYGGAVDATNSAEFLASPRIDGLLIGSASRDADVLTTIVIQH